jgi:hypothetical protein
LNLPVSVVVLFVRMNVPSARAAGLDGYELGPILQGTLGGKVEVEVLFVVNVLNRPTVAVTSFFNLPLHGEVRIRP